jgi:diguanylate cyclase (GGDEF)-like protein
MGDAKARLLGAYVFTATPGRWSRSIRVSMALAVVTVVWFTVNFDHPRGPLVLMWLPAPATLLLTWLASLRTGRCAWLPGPTRRFWRQFTLTVALVGLGTISQAYDMLSGPMVSQHISSITLGIYASGILVILWAMYRLPLGASSRGDRLRIGLDAGTVVLAAAIFMWHYQTRPLLENKADHSTSILADSMTMVLALVAVFAVAKAVLSAHAFVDKVSLRLLALAVLVGSLGEIPQTYMRDKPYLVCTQVTIPIIAILAVRAAERQRRPEARGRQIRSKPARTYSLLPYLAVAAVDGLLLTSTWNGGLGDERPIAVAAVALTALVVLRQLTAFQDNGRLLARLDHNATHDAMTQLPNRALFRQRLQMALSAPGADHRVSVALIDLDDFKLVNDTLGHSVGDALLVEIAPRLSGMVRSEDTVARLGGDEFVVVLEDIDPADAERIVQRMIDALSTPVLAEGHELLVHASIGIADGRSGDDPSELLRRADVAMYAAKSSSGSGYVHFTEGLAAGALEQARLGADLGEAINRNELFAMYQPIVALDREQILGVEALVRWNHPTLGSLSPMEFLPTAESTGLIVPLGRWIIRQGCEQLVAWRAEYGDAAPATLSVNISAGQLRDPSFANDVAAALHETDIAPSQLVLEITETTAAALGAHVAMIHTLRRHGVRIAFDDFGSAQSTLSLLQTCPVDQLKLDASFVQTDPTHRNAMAAVVIQLARALGLPVVAEGVETQQQEDQLRALGYEAAQGYHFARPMTAASLTQMLAGKAPAHTAA